MPRFARLAGLLVLFACGHAAAAAPVWFVVAEVNPFRNQSFLLPLTDPADIADARRRIAEGDASGVGSIVSARIAAGGDGFNRDVRQPGQPLWSWRVTQFDGFADSAIELCDGWPGFIEADVHGFIANTGGQICFWGYTVVEELAAAPEFAIGEGIDGAWYDPSTPGQGLFVDVLAGATQLAFGWFGFQPGAAGTQRWWTAQGVVTGGEASLEVYLTSNGAFASPDPVDTAPVGEATLRFTDCNHGSLEYAFEAGPSGTMPLERVLHVDSCHPH